ncbi:MAG: hypothetical protein BWK72_08445 [Rhodoferax ferrireducens]|uniref:Uncharacterized protein n=1 Tax=Rhodoferax ferrireducens TaxID=192843 RepID=A0A1W9KUV4_9BURK|nr:MAG: hypothetical protein BWK72_08445 [Rhodoferax ferrireducens]
MTPDMLKNELDRAEDAELQSDEQLRQLTDLIDKTCGPSPAMNASDCAKVVTAALALNDRLRTRTEKLRSEVRMVAARAESDVRNAQFKALTQKQFAAANQSAKS